MHHASLDKLNIYLSRIKVTKEISLTLRLVAAIRVAIFSLDNNK
jgi:hypothetical protein